MKAVHTEYIFNIECNVSKKDKINNLFPPKKTTIKEHIKSIIRRRKEIIWIRIEIKDIESKKSIRDQQNQKQVLWKDQLNQYTFSQTD